MSGQWKLVEGTPIEEEGELVTWANPEQQIFGKYLGKREKTGGMKSPMHSIKTKTGDILKFWETLILGDRLAKVKVGDTVRITYKGKKKNEKTGNDWHDFVVEVWGDDAVAANV